MGMMIRPGVFYLATLLSWLAAGALCAQTFQTNLTYVCGGERMIIESCNMRDVSDNSSCLVQHPDRPQHNGFPAYTNETRGALKQLIPTCQQPSADAVAREQARQKKQNDQQDAAMKKALGPPSVAVLPNAVPNTLPNAVPSAVANRTAPTDANRDLVRCLESGRSQSQCG